MEMAIPQFQVHISGWFKFPTTVCFPPGFEKQIWKTTLYNKLTYSMIWRFNIRPNYINSGMMWDVLYCIFIS